MSEPLKRRFVDQILVMLGKEPEKARKPGDFTERARQAHELKRILGISECVASCELRA